MPLSQVRILIVPRLWQSGITSKIKIRIKIKNLTVVGCLMLVGLRACSVSTAARFKSRAV